MINVKPPILQQKLDISILAYQEELGLAVAYVNMKYRHPMLFDLVQPSGPSQA